MRILAIRGCNLASLAGEFLVDFEAEPLASTGLYAISGPTGAGKSTLLDALCLALYHDTPRLQAAGERQSTVPDGRNGAISTRDPRNLLRRGAGSGWAEVDFVDRGQRRWRARWSARRARGKADGALQAAEASLVDLTDGSVHGGRIVEIRQKLVELIGLDFGQFCRSVLLAQNDFATLLKAPQKERADLLESLTGTGIFQRLSALAHQRHAERRTRLAELGAELARIRPLPDEERSALQDRLTQLRAEDDALAAAIASLEAQRDQHRIGARLAADLARHSEELQRHAEALAADAGEGLALTRWQLAEHHAPLLKLRAKAAARGRELADRLPALESELSAAAQALAGLEQELAARSEVLERSTLARAAAEPALLVARGLDRQLAIAETERAATQARIMACTQRDIRLVQTITQLSEGRERGGAADSAGSVLEHLERALIASHEALKRATEAIERMEAEHTAFAPDSLYAEREQLSGQRARLSAAEAALQAVARAEMARDEASAEVARAQERRMQGQREAEAAHSASAQARSALTLAEHAYERASLLADGHTERLRELLVNGEPCPVCGATEHPGSHDPALRAVLASLEDERRRARATLDAAREAEQAAGTALALAEDAHQRAGQALEMATATLASAVVEQERALASLWPEGIPGTDPMQALAALAQTLAASEQQLQSRQARLRALEEQLASLRPQARSTEASHRELGERLAQARLLDAERQQLAAERAELEQAKQAQRDQLETLLRERRAALPEPDVDAHQRRLDGDIATARQVLDGVTGKVESARTKRNDIAQQLDRSQRERDTALRAAESHVIELEQALDERRRSGAACAPTLTELEAWFASIPGDLSARLGNWQARQQRLQELDTLCGDLESRLEAWRSESGSLCPVEEIDADLSSATASRSELLQAIGAKSQQLRDDDARRVEAGTRLAALETEREQARPWQQLDELIGAADGSVFRKYAQQFTLELLIEEANAHLARLTRRYRLTRGSEELGLLVVDLEMGEELRSVHSLSGGETFLVSLALALGLASLASQRVRVESLFIDEGFGSLDADTLNTAMEALDRLQSQGRRVGVISHVAEMAERIGVQVRVRPTGAGRSVVEVDG